MTTALQPGVTPAHHEPPDRSALDLRLALPALTVWLGALLLTTVPAWVSLVTGLCTVAVMAWTTFRSLRRVSIGHPPSAILTCGALLLLALSCAARTTAREAGNIGELTRTGATVELSGIVSSATALSSGASGTSRVLLSLDALRGAQDPDWSPCGAAVQLFVTDDLTPGSRLVLRARLTETEARHDRAVATARVVGDLEVRDGPDRLTALLAGRRSGLAALADRLPGDAGALLPAVTVGDTATVGDLAAVMKTSGLAHLTAVSGAHFSMVGAVVFTAVSWCGVPRRWRWLPVTVISAGFVALVGPGPTVLRAALMGAVGVLGIAVGRPSRVLPALLAAVLLLIIADPWLCADLGFLLSVLATAGIAIFATPLAALWADRASTGFATALAVPLAAQAACAPAIVLIDPAVALYAIPANIVAAPAVGPATVGGLVAALCAGWWPLAAELSAAFAGAACWWIGAVARTCSALPGARVTWLAGWPGVLMLAVASAAGVGLLLRCRLGMAP